MITKIKWIFMNVKMMNLYQILTKKIKKLKFKPVKKKKIKLVFLDHPLLLRKNLTNILESKTNEFNQF